VTGAAVGASSVVLVTLGTGIGGAIAVDGQVLRGANGMAAEVGHTMVDPSGPPCPCGLRGCWERYASGAGLARIARDAAEAGRLGAVADQAGGVAAIRGEDVVAGVRDGDPDALAVMNEFAWWTAVGLANLAAVLDPELLLVGGGVVDAADFWLEETRRRLPDLLVASAHRTVPSLDRAAHGSGASALGAALLARPPA
jgi:glucokinase